MYIIVCHNNTIVSKGKGNNSFQKRAKAGGGDQRELWMFLETSYSSVWLSTYKHQHKKIVIMKGHSI